MHDWDVIRCSDHHFRRAIYGLGPYIADYPEQTAASGIVYNWCVTFVWSNVRSLARPSTHFVRCDANPNDLDKPDANLQTREWTAALLNNKDTELLWYNHGIIPDFQVCRHNYHFDVVLIRMQPFMMRFLRADIHELLTPDLLHQVIKGTYKDHLVQWVEDYLKIAHGPSKGESILDEIDRRCVES